MRFRFWVKIYNRIVLKCYRVIPAAIGKINFSRLLIFVLFVCFCLGIIFGRFFSNFFSLFIFSALLAAIFSLLFYRYGKLFLSDLFILIFFLFLGALWQAPDSANSVEKFLKKDSMISLQVTSLPKVKSRKRTFTAEVKEINSYSLKQRIKVNDYTQSMEYLNCYQLRGKIAKRRYRNYLFYSLNIKKESGLKELPLKGLDRFRKKAATYVLNVFKKNCSNQGYRLLSAVFLGRREVLNEEKEIFANAGVSHIPPMQCRGNHSYSITGTFAV